MHTVRMFTSASCSAGVVTKRRRRLRVFCRKLSRKDKEMRVAMRMGEVVPQDATKSVKEETASGCLDLLTAAAMSLDRAEREVRVPPTFVVLQSSGTSAWSRTRKDAAEAACVRRRVAEAEARRTERIRANQERAAEIREAMDAERVLRFKLWEAKGTACEALAEEEVARMRWNYSHVWTEEVLAIAWVECDKEENAS